MRACVYVMGEAGLRGHVDSHRWCVCVCACACVYVMGEAGPRGHVDSHRWWPELQMEVGVGGLGGLGPLPLTGAPSVGGRGVNLGGDPSGDVEASSAG